MARPRRLDEVQRARICSEFVAGEEYAALAKKYDVALNTIKRAVKDAGITKKDRTAASQTTAKEKAEVAAAYEGIDAGDLSDPLNAVSWLFTAAVISAKRVATDPNYPGTEAERRKELAALSASAKKLMPMAELRRARKMLEEDAKDMAQGAGPQMRKVGKPKRKRTRWIPGEQPERGEK